MIALDGIIFSIQKYGGISVYFNQLIKYLGEHDVANIVYLENPLKQKLNPSSNFVNREARFFERYMDCRLDEKPSVFHSSYYRKPSKSYVPSVVTVHDFIYEKYQSGAKKWVHSLQKFSSIRSAEAIICISESTKNDLLEFVEGVETKKIHVIHNGVSNVFRRLGASTSSRPYVLFVGQRSGYKNFNLILATMTYLPDFELRCVGGGDIRPDELDGLSQSVVDRVRHLGFVLDEQLNDLYNHATCLVYPSSYEGFGIPVIEAMKAGCPVVCVDCKAVLEVGMDALSVVYDGDPKTMANAILNTLSSSRANLIGRGLAVAQGYSWNITHRQTLDIYRSLGA